MSPSHVHRTLRRLRRARVLPAAVVVVLGLAIALHHGVVSADHGEHGMDMGAVMELCLGVFTAVGAAVAAVVLGSIGLGRWRPPGTLAAWARPVASPLPDLRTRAGPVFLCVHRR